MLKLILIFFFSFYSCFFFGQIKESVLYLDKDGIECKLNDYPTKKIVISKVMDRSFIVSESSYYDKTKKWYRKTNYKEIRTTYDSSVFYIKTIYETCCNEPNFTDNNHIKVIVSKIDTLFQIKEYDNKGHLIRQGSSAYKFPFIWDGVLKEYYANSKVKREKIYSKNKLLSAKLWTSNGVQIKKWHIFEGVDKKPCFINSELDFDKELKIFMSRNVIYPKEALNYGFMGTVYISFIITKTGKVNCVDILRGIYPALDKECIKVINNLPLLSPGYINNKPVNVKYFTQIEFRRD